MADVRIIIDGDSGGLERAAWRARNAIAALGDVAKFALGTVVANAAMSAAGALARIGRSAISSAAEYQSGLNVFQSVSGATAEQMKAVSNKAKELGADMTLPGVSAATAAEAMTELAKAGLTVEEAMAAAKGALQLAAASGVDAARAAEITAGALNAFGLVGKDATRVADLLAASANASAADISDMADALKMSSAVAALSGQKIEELTTAIALMANAGIRGSDAGTSLKTMLMRLTTPTEEAADLMRTLGIKIFDAQGKMLPMRNIVEQFSNALNKLTQEQKQAALAAIFGSDAIRAASVVLTAGVEKYDSMFAAVTRQGAAADLAGARMKGLKGAIEGLVSQLETLAIIAGEPLLQPLERAVRWIAGLLEGDAVTGAVSKHFERLATLLNKSLDKLIENWPKVSATISQTAGAIIAALSPLAKFIGGSFIGRFKLAGDIVSENWDGIKVAVSSTVNAVTRILERFSKASETYVAPFIKQAAGLVIENWPRIVSVVESVADGVFDAIDKIAVFVPETLMPAFQSVLNWLNANWPRFASTVKGVVDDVFEAIGKASGFASATLAPAFRSVLSWIETNWPKVRDAIAPVIETVTSVIGEIAALAEKHLLPVFKAVADWFAANLPKLGEIVKDAVWIIVNVFKDVLPLVVPVAETLFKAIGLVVERVLLPAMTMIVEGMANVVSWVRENWPAIAKTVSVVINAIKSVIDVVLPPLATVVGDVLKSALSLASGVMNAMLSIIKAILLAIQGDWSGAWTAIGQAVKSVWSGIEGFFSGLPARLVDVGRKMIEGLVSGILQAAGAMRAAVEAAVSNAISAAKQALGIRSPSRVFAAIGEQSAAGFIEGLEEMMRKTRFAMSAVVSSPDSFSVAAPRFQRVETNNYYYSLNVQTARATDDVISDYRLMRRA